MLNIQNLTILSNDDTTLTLLKNVNLLLQAGACHCLLGSNGAGKTSLIRSIMRDPGLCIAKGTIYWHDHQLSDLTTQQIASLGVFPTFQDPLSISGISLLQLCKAVFYAHKPDYPLRDFLELIELESGKLGISKEALRRDFNCASSGGEKKLHEVLQLALLQPSLVLFDEIDSGMHVNNLHKILAMINKLLSSGSTILVVTHALSWLELLKPSSVHIMQNGTIVESGDISLGRAYLTYAQL